MVNLLNKKAAPHTTSELPDLETVIDGKLMAIKFKNPSIIYIRRPNSDLIGSVGLKNRIRNTVDKNGTFNTLDLLNYN